MGDKYMIDLRQKDLEKWQNKNFGHATSEQLALGMAEEIGELCHYILKRSQGIREAAVSDVKLEIADAFGDVMIFGINLMTNEGLDAEKVIKETIELVLKRDWVLNQKTGEK